MGRPRGTGKKVDLDKLRALSLIGCSYELIASELGISHDTLQRRFLPLVHESRGKGKIKILGKAFQMACSGHARLLEVFLINWLGFTLRPETVVNVTQNANQQPFAVTEQQKAELYKMACDIRRRAAEHHNGEEPPPNPRSMGLPN